MMRARLRRIWRVRFMTSTSGWRSFSLRVGGAAENRSEEHTSELQSLRHLVCRLLLDKTKPILVLLPTPPALHTPPPGREPTHPRLPSFGHCPLPPPLLNSARLSQSTLHNTFASSRDV